MAYSVVLPNGYRVSDERARLDMAFVHESLAGVYWGMDRKPEITERSWANCLCFGLYAPDQAMVGFARLLTDYALRAHLGDVFVHPDVRGRGLSVGLVRAVLDHPELVTVRHWTLTTRDAHGVYKRFGFRSGEADGSWMTMVRKGG